MIKYSIEIIYKGIIRLKYAEKIIAAAVSAALMAGCTAQNTDTAVTESVASATAVQTTVSEELASEKTASVTIEQTVSETERTPVTESETVTEITTVYEPPQTISVHTNSPADVQPQTVGLAFVDYRFEDAVSSEITEDIKERAVTALKESDYYFASNKYRDELKKFIEKEIQWYTEHEKELEGTAYDVDYFDSDGNIVPNVSAAYTYDYDNNGREETFAVVDMPHKIYKNNCLRSFIIFLSDDYNDEIADNFSNIESVRVLDYGYCRQLVINSYGIMGADDTDVIYGVVNGKAEMLYVIRGDFYKTGFLLGTYGWQGSGSTMYFDNVKMKYMDIGGEFVSVDDVIAMDTNGTITAKVNQYREDFGDAFMIFLLGDRFYCFVNGVYDMGEVYEFKDGGFVSVNEEMSAVRYSGFQGVDIDLNTAFDNMLTPEEAAEQVVTVNDSGIPLALYTEVSDGNVFVDFKMEQMQENKNVPEICEAAVQIFKDSKYHIDYTDEQVKMLKERFDEIRENFGNPDELNDIDKAYFEEYFSEDGTVEPKLYKVYSVKTSSFYDEMNHIAVVNTPYLFNGEFPCLRSFVLYLSEDGQLIKILDNFSNFEEPVFLDYGSYGKQVILSGDGIMGADDHDVIYALSNYEFSTEKLYSGRCYFVKDGCLLGVYGWQGSGGTMYYDTVAQEYRYIIGSKLDLETVRAMDTNGDIAEFISQWEKGEVYGATLIGNKYYCLVYGMMDSGEVYTYENGRFAKSDNAAVRFTYESRYSELKMVHNIDLNQ